MDDLIARIRAAIDEDERIAKAAVNWSYGAQEWADAGEPDWVHIARHDPARVLRQVAAHRKILERHKAVWLELPWTKANFCKWTLEFAAREEWPCPDVLDIAEIYGIEVAEGE